MEQMGFDDLADESYQWTCKVETCGNPVAAPNTMCVSCFSKILTREVIQTKDGRLIFHNPKRGRNDRNL
jgi:hypothetical protein